MMLRKGHRPTAKGSTRGKDRTLQSPPTHRLPSEYPSSENPTGEHLTRTLQTVYKVEQQIAAHLIAHAPC